MLNTSGKTCFAAVPSLRQLQQGVMLLEALVAIAVFSIGVLGLIGLQSAAIKNTDEARQRAAAAFFANQIIGSMWADVRTQANLLTYAHNVADPDKTADAGCGSFPASPSANTKVSDWVAAVQKDLNGATGAGLQQITVDPNNVVAVTLCWKNPGESAYHFFTSVAQIQG